MVDSTKGTTMADVVDDLAKRVQTVEGKMDKMSASLDTLTGSVAELTQLMTQRFDHVAAALAEQRRYTEFAHKDLSEKMDAGFGRVHARFDNVTGAIVEQRQDIEFAHNQLGERMDAGFNRVDDRLAQVDERFDRMDDRFDRVEHKLDRLLDHLPPTSEERTITADS